MGHRLTDSPDSNLWDAYVSAHPRATLYHLSSWLDAIRSAYGHKVYSLAAIEPGDADRIAGVLPLVHIKHPLFGNRLVSMPFFDIGGILADDEAAESALLQEAAQIATTLRAGAVELRSTGPLAAPITPAWRLQTSSHKVRMLLELPGSAETLMGSFKSKLRSQIKKPTREGLKARIGGSELLDDFYGGFLVNMRDLGSPVHSKKFIRQVLERLSGRAQVVVVYKDETAVAASIMVGFKDTLCNPWASSLKAYSSLSPNMLLYWSMLEYACNHGFRYFEFGRSTPGEGTFKFKEQWGAKPITLHWHSISRNGLETGDSLSANAKMRYASRIWQRLPVCFTQMVGPRIRKYISL